MMSRLASCIAGLLLVAGVASAEDAYLQSNGGQSINLGYFMNPKSRIEVDFQYPTAPSGNILFGAWNDGAKLCTAFWNSNGKFSFVLNDGTMASYSSTVACDNQRHVAVIDVPNRGFSLLQNGTSQWSGSIGATRTCNNTAEWPVVVFGACSNAAGDGKQMVSAKVYTIKIYEDGALIHDFRPCLKGRDPGFLDKVTGDFKYGRGTTDLVCGGDYDTIEDDPYVESSAVNGNGPVVNTGYFMKPNSRIEVDFQYPEKPTNNILFGPYDAGAKLSTAFWNDGGKYCFIVKDNGYDNIKTTVDCDARRHTAIIDVATKKYSLVRNGYVEASGTSTNTCNNTAEWPIVLFGATGNANGNGKQCVSARIFSVKIYEDNELVRDFVPCKQAGVIGFLEMKTGKFVKDDRVGGKTLTASENVMEYEDGYVRSGTTAWGINLGYRMNPASRIEVDFANDGTWAGKFLFGAWTNEESLRSLVWFNGTNLDYILNDGSGFKTYSSGITGDTYRHTAVIDVPNAAFHYITGFTTNWTGNAVAVPVNTANNPIALFASSTNAEGTGFGAPIGAKIYAARIYENGILIKNYLPYVKNGEPGFRDELTGGFIGQGANMLPMTAGGDIAYDNLDAYVESDGSQVINTGYFASTASRIEVDFQANTLKENKLLFGAWASGAVLRYCSWFDGGVNKCILGSGDKSPNNVVGMLDIRRHTSIIDIKNQMFYLVTDGVTTYSTRASGSGISGDEKGRHPMGIFGGLNDAAGTVPNMSSKSRIYSVRIYEDDVLKHEFLPCKDGDSVGFRDVKTGAFAKKHASTVAEPKIGGCGWGTDHAAFYAEPKSGIVQVGETTRLSAFAPGAISYQWYREGCPVEGETGPSLDVAWKHRGGAETYAVKAVFDCYGNKVERMSSEAIVTHELQGMMIIVR